MFDSNSQKWKIARGVAGAACSSPVLLIVFFIAMFGLGGIAKFFLGIAYCCAGLMLLSFVYGVAVFGVRESVRTEHSKMMLWGLFASIIYISGYLMLTDEREIVVDADGDASWVTPILRSIVEPQRFYEGQLRLVEAELNAMAEHYKSGAQQAAEDDMKMNQIERDLGLDAIVAEAQRQRNQEVIIKQPLPAEVAAKNYRAQADQLDKLAHRQRRAQYYDMDFQQKWSALQQKRHAIQRKLSPSSDISPLSH